MKTITRIGLAALPLVTSLVTLLAAAPALAGHGPRDASINQRQHALEQRIEQGRRSGELTPREYQRLRVQAREIERAEHEFRSDGRLSARERGELNARLDRLARVVYREKHDGERLGGSYNRGYPTDRRF